MKDNPELWARFLRAGAALALIYAEKLSPTTDEGKNGGKGSKK